MAVVDCTGHGVPGAFMSIIGHTLLNEIVVIHGITEPAEILNRLGTEVRILLRQDDKDTDSNDGMDIAIISYNQTTRILEFAGADRPLVCFSGSQCEIKKGNISGIGGYQPKLEFGFTNYTIQTQPHDCLFMFSDGYADQFGGPRGKKLMSRRLIELLKEIKDDAPFEQEIKLNHYHENWKGEEEQTDDVLVIGIKF